MLLAIIYGYSTCHISLNDTPRANIDTQPIVNHKYPKCLTDRHIIDINIIVFVVGFASRQPQHFTKQSKSTSHLIGHRYEMADSNMDYILQCTQD